MRLRRATFLELAVPVGLAIGALAIPTLAYAEGSGGTSGTAGERSDWPCDGCFFHPPSGYSSATPVPMLVALHGDEGDPAAYIEYAMPEPTARAGYALLALKCPRDEGCGGSWYQWADSGRYDPAWLEAQVDLVEHEYNVERNRIYLAGFSGGAYFLASYAPRHTDRFAGVLYMGGGSGQQDGCPPCKMPAFFLLGANDGSHLSSSRDTEQFFRGCGHEVQYTTEPGLGHMIATERLGEVFAWFDARPHMCRMPAAPPPAMPDAGASTKPPPAPAPIGDAGPGAARDASSAPPRAMGRPTHQVTSGCSATPHPRALGLGWVGLGVLALLVRKRKSPRSMRPRGLPSERD